MLAWTSTECEILVVEMIPGTSNIWSKVVGGEPSVQIPLMSDSWTTLLGMGVHLSESASHMLQNAFTSLVLEPVSSVRHEAAAAFSFFFFYTSHITSYLARTDKKYLHHLHYSTKYSRLCTTYSETLLIAITKYNTIIGFN